MPDGIITYTVGSQGCCIPEAAVLAEPVPASSLKVDHYTTGATCLQLTCRHSYVGTKSSLFTNAIGRSSQTTSQHRNGLKGSCSNAARQVAVQPADTYSGHKPASRYLYLHSRTPGQLKPRQARSACLSFVSGTLPVHRRSVTLCSVYYPSQTDLSASCWLVSG